MSADYSTDDKLHKGNRGLTRAWHAAKNSWSGLVLAVREESAFRQELTLAVILVPIAVFLPFRALEKVLDRKKGGRTPFSPKRGASPFPPSDRAVSV